MTSLRKLLGVVLLAALPCLGMAMDAVNINTADASTLAQAINGVGMARAEAIVAYREQNGAFHSVDDLTKVKGIGQKIVDANRDALTVGE